MNTPKYNDIFRITSYFFICSSYEAIIFHITVSLLSFHFFFLICPFQSVTEQKFLLLQSIACISVMIFMMFVFCYFGDVVTTKSAAVADKAYQTMWYMYPVRMQPYIILIMLQSQKPFFLKGFDLISCSLENFTWVSKPHH